MDVEIIVMRQGILAVVVAVIVVLIGLVLISSRPITVNSGNSSEGASMKIDQTQAATQNPHRSSDPLVANDYGPAPEFNNHTWLNMDKPLKIADQKGKVVLIEFWTFECINCQHTFEAMKGFYDKYHDNGLVIMTDHFPEFATERDVNNVKQALADNGIKYPVAIDNDGATWNAYGQRYWPTMYLVDKQGTIGYVAIGEHDYSKTEQAIKALISE